MFDRTKYNQVVVNMVQRIITDGKHLCNDNGLVIGYKDRKGKVVSFAAYKGDASAEVTVMENVYEGIDPHKAATMYVEIVGSFNAFGEAVRYFREKNATIVVE